MRTSLPAAVRVLVLARAVNRLGAFTLPFLAVVLVEEHDFPLVVAGAVVSLFGLATIPSRLLGGRLADRLGRTRTIVVGLGGCAVGQLGVALAPGPGWVVASVLLLGLAFEVYEPATQAVVADSCSAEQRSAAFGLLGAAMATAGVVAGLLAAWLGGIDLRLLFVVDAATCVACAVLVALALPGEHPPTVSRSSATCSRGGNPWRDRRLLAMTATGVVFATVYLQITIGLPLTLVERGRPAGEIGLLLTVSAATIVLGQPLLRGAVGRRLSGFRALTVGYVVLAAGLLAAGWAVDLGTFIAATVLWSVGDLLLLGHAHTIVAGLADEGSRGRYLAVFGTSWGVAAVVAPAAGTGAIAAGGPPVLWTSAAAAAVVLALAQPALRRLCEPQPPCCPGASSCCSSDSDSAEATNSSSSPDSIGCSASGV